MEKELPGILAWIVRGAVEYARDGLNIPNQLKQAKKQKQADTDPLADFWAACVDDIDADAKTAAADLFVAYENFCKTNAAGAISETAFGRQLRERGHEKIKAGRIFWRGVKLTRAGQAYKRGQVNALLHSDTETQKAAEVAQKPAEGHRAAQAATEAQRAAWDAKDARITAEAAPAYDGPDYGPGDEMTEEDWAARLGL
ncbi:MAG: hypothetical protein Q4G22_04620 [Paracoccus sp. (in: a-proteobacteria)]|uniref:hypothetical protein n=1 Tax=Paracoccus sp. TaxID=267 RepID=UPI0026DF848D|nr:hypothetical protein [Paracoccus sp. (in: a-proteobacteria)]MDO5631102.1 hypothetical protein [Paracoccus sp. (in: a-proteobacteria)]